MEEIQRLDLWGVRRDSLVEASRNAHTNKEANFQYLASTCIILRFALTLAWSLSLSPWSVDHMKGTWIAQAEYAAYATNLVLR